MTRNIFNNISIFLHLFDQNHDKVLRYQDRLFALDAEIMGDIRKDVLTFQSYKEKYQAQRLKYTRQIDTLIAKRKHISVQNKKTKKWPSKKKNSKFLWKFLRKRHVGPTWVETVGVDPARKVLHNEGLCSGKEIISFELFFLFFALENSPDRTFVCIWLSTFLKSFRSPLFWVQIILEISKKVRQSSIQNASRPKPDTK